MKAKIVRDFKVFHFIRKQRINLVDDTFTIVTSRHKQTSVVIRTITLEFPEEMIPVAIAVEQTIGT